MSDDLENNNDDLGQDASFDEFEQQKSLGDLWRNNPMVKVGVILAAGAAIFFTIMLFGGEEAPVDVSTMSGGADVTAAPGTTEATPKYVEAIKDFNEAEREEAIKTGGSAMPVPIEPPASRLEAPAEEAETEDPLQRWRRLQEERLKREVKQREAVKPAEIPGQNQQAAAANEAVQAMAEVMNQQMSAILESQATTTVNYKAMTGPGWLKDMEDAKKKELQAAAAAQGTGTTLKEILIPAGKIEYAQLLTEANSDVEGPILAQIVSGPMAGSRVLGSFEKEDEAVEYLVLEFNTLVTPDGVSHDMDGVAIDPETALPGMATEVDHHYLKRIVLPMAAAFIEGVAEAGAKTTTTVVTVNDGGVVEDEEEADTGQQISLGVDKAGEELREILDDMADETEVTVIVHAGTPFGLLFLEELAREESM